MLMSLEEGQESNLRCRMSESCTGGQDYLGRLVVPSRFLFMK